MNETVTSFFPEHFGTMLMALVIVFTLVMVLFFIGYRLIDKATPGDLSKELLGRSPSVPTPEPHKPNIALAVVVASMVIGLSMILGATVLGVMVH